MKHLKMSWNGHIPRFHGKGITGHFWTGFKMTVGIFAFLSARMSMGAIDHRATFAKKNIYVTHGAVIGGVAGRGFTLLGIQRKMGETSGMERIVINVGDELGAPVMGLPGYYHLEIDSQRGRILLEMSQVQRSVAAENELRQQVAKSPYISLQEVTYDPEDKSTGLIFKMKKPVKVEVFSPNKAKVSGRIVLDLLPQSNSVNPSSSPKS